MRVFRPSYKNGGEPRKSRTWHIDFQDHRGIRRRVAGFRDRKATEGLGRKIDALVSCAASREPLPPELSRWLEDVPAKLRARLENFGLLATAKVAALRPLVEHLDGAPDAPGYRQHLEAKGNTAGHVEQTCSRVRRILEGCRFSFWSSIDGAKVAGFLHGLRGDKADGQGGVKPGVSPATSNYHLAALKSFCRWMVSDRRASESPVAHLDGLNARTDRRRVRRALDVEEIRWLLDTTRNGPQRYGMTGPARAMLYRVAIESGLRRGELASLTRASFALEGERLTVTVAAAYSKRRREDVLPLRPDTAAELRDLLAGKHPAAPAFNMPHRRHESSAMWKADLADARQAWLEAAATPQERQDRERQSFLAYQDAAGRFADFHALRHTCGSLLAAAGTHPKVAQSIMRHSTIDLTMSRYTHVFAGQEADAIAALPDLDAAPARQSGRATGTYDAQADQGAPGWPQTSERRQDRPTPRLVGRGDSDAVADVIPAAGECTAAGQGGAAENGPRAHAKTLRKQGGKPRTSANGNGQNHAHARGDEDPHEQRLKPAPVSIAGGGTRTHTLLPEQDFESCASANSATPAGGPQFILCGAKGKGGPGRAARRRLLLRPVT